MLFCFSHRRQSASAAVTAGIAVIFLMMAASNNNNNNNNNNVVVEAFPSGAGSCVTNNTTDISPHVNMQTTETFTSRGYEIVLTSSSGGAELVATASPNVNSIDAGVTYKVSVRNNRLTFRGASIVLDGDDDSSELVPTNGDANVREHTFCTDVGLLGITHTDRSDKSSLSGEMKVASAGDATLHVTVVEVYDSTDNIYFYEQVALTAVVAAPSSSGSAPSSSSAPVVPAPPTTITAPTATSPTMTVPVASPISSPVASPVASPVTAPTSSASAGALTCGGWTTAAVVAMVGSTTLLVTMMH